MATVREYADKLAPKLGVGQLLKVRLLVQEDDFGAAPMPEAAPAPDAAETTADGGIDAAFQAVALKELADCMAAKGDPAKLKRCLGRLKKLLMTHGELSAGDVDGEETEGEGEGEGEGEVGEAAPGKGKKKPKKKVAEAAPPAVTLADVIAECDAEQFSPTPLVREAALGIPDKGRRVQFIREQKGIAAAKPPASQGRTGAAAESAAGGGAKTGVEEARERAAKYARENQGVPPAAK